MQIDNTIAAVVTGGASGLGRASAEALAAAGARVAIFDVNEEAGEALAKELGGVFCNVNILNEDSVEAGFLKAREAHGQERIVVHCAVVAGGGKTVSWDKENNRYKRTPTEQIAKSAEGIFTASYRVASIAALGMANADPLNDDGERGCIIFTSSAASEDGQIGQVAYGGGKGAVNSMVLPMARDLMDLGIRVNAILPGIVEGDRIRRVIEAKSQVLGKPFEQVKSEWLALASIKEMVQPEQLADMMLLVASKRGRTISGQALSIDSDLQMLV